jgi:hypothetical protein
MTLIKKPTSATPILLDACDVVAISGGMVLSDEQAAKRDAARACEPAPPLADSPLRRQIVMA